ncbi:hypothetical protein LEP1GSC059_0778 [Leptospira noguchii serovar Panama str. CZ214]|uniref:Uncharacterized protein n=1 Tax=Leptospira noguchii serovar Panama str. CZ214 TaxID=1001595 RepID=T0GYM5_9LEPT|nr:hypothetical protein LEP1GSC059_0778 [Leptospira noguchii serovar Panama str. CZ214]
MDLFEITPKRKNYTIKKNEAAANICKIEFLKNEFSINFCFTETID